MFKIVAIAGLAVCAALGAAYLLLSDRSAPANPVAATVGQQDQTTLNRHGVIIFQRWDGSDCGRKVIDNATGQLHGSANVGCANELSAHRDQAKPRYDPGGRIDAVRSGFYADKNTK